MKPIQIRSGVVGVEVCGMWFEEGYRPHYYTRGKMMLFLEDGHWTCRLGSEMFHADSPEAALEAAAHWVFQMARLLNDFEKETETR